MPPGPPYRALLLPVLAVLVPSIFIVMLASWWLALRHEAVQLRGGAAAASSLVRLRASLLSDIGSEAEDLARGGTVARSGNAIQPTLSRDTVFFDEAGQVLSVDGIPPPAALPETSKRRAADLLAHGPRRSSAGGPRSPAAAAN